MSLAVSYIVSYSPKKMRIRNTQASMTAQWIAACRKVRGGGIALIWMKDARNANTATKMTISMMNNIRRRLFMRLSLFDVVTHDAVAIMCGMRNAVCPSRQKYQMSL